LCHTHHHNILLLALQIASIESNDLDWRNGLVWLVPHRVAPQHPTPDTPGSPAQNPYGLVWYSGMVWLVPHSVAPQHPTPDTPGSPAQNPYGLVWYNGLVWLVSHVQP
jgi:hypothetical protein